MQKRIHSPLKTLLTDRRAVLGTTITVTHPAVVEAVIAAGFDWLLIDVERGFVGFEDLRYVLRAVDFGATIPLVRVADVPAGNVTRAVNAGALGVVVPKVRRPADVAQAVEAVKYPPAGNRSLGSNMLAGFENDLAGYIRQANESSVIMAEIGDPAGLENLEPIAGVAGLDGLMLDVETLTSSLGPAESSYAAVRDLGWRVLDAAEQAGIVAGVIVAQPAPDEVAQWVEAGFRLVAYGRDTEFLAQGCREAVEPLRDLLEDLP